MKSNTLKLAGLALLFVICYSTVAVQATDYSSLVSASPGLIGYWRFDAFYQTNSMVNGYTGSLQGSAQIGAPGSGCPLSSDPGNQALVLDGNNSYLATGLTGKIVSEGTVLVWVYLAAQPSTAGHIFQITSQAEWGNDFDFQIQTDNQTYFFTDGGSAVVYPQALPLNEWHFLAATFVANSTRSIYLDGQCVASSPAGSHSENSNPFWIGNNSVFGPRCFLGSIDEVAVFNRALTNVEIAALYSAATTPSLTIIPLKNAVRLTWSTNITGFLLQTNSSLTTTNWATIAESYNILGADNVVTNIIGDKMLYYRLIK